MGSHGLIHLCPILIKNLKFEIWDKRIPRISRAYHVPTNGRKEREPPAIKIDGKNGLYKGRSGGCSELYCHEAIPTELWCRTPHVIQKGHPVISSGSESVCKGEEDSV
jgi:hypothetical protein